MLELLELELLELEESSGGGFVDLDLDLEEEEEEEEDSEEGEEEEGMTPAMASARAFAPRRLTAFPATERVVSFPPVRPAARPPTPPFPRLLNPTSRSLRFRAVERSEAREGPDWSPRALFERLREVRDFEEDDVWAWEEGVGVGVGVGEGVVVRERREESS